MTKLALDKVRLSNPLRPIHTELLEGLLALPEEPQVLVILIQGN